MKKIIRYTFLFWTLLLATSCVDPFEESVKTGLKGDYGIDLSVICTTPPTKASEVVVGPKPGDDNYNENKVNYVDWFIFKSESDSDISLKHGRASVSQASSSDGLQTEGITIVPGLNMDDIVTDSRRSFYIYAIANMPGVNSHEAMPVKLADLKALDLATTFNVNPFSKQNNFVMSGGTTLTFADSDKGTLKTVTVELSRVAAKVSVNINVAPAIDQLTTLSTGERQYEKTWYPVLSSIQVYLSFANEETTLAAEPVTYDQSPSTFFTYDRAAFKPYYSYTGAEGAPSESAPTNTPDWDNNSWKWEVTGTPFYSYPMAWTSDSPQAPFLKVILKWLSYDETPPVEEPYYVDTEDGKKFVRAKRAKSSSSMIDAEREFYYKIPIPSETLSLEANDWYDLTFDVAILGGTTDELPVVLSGQYFVVDWNDPHIQDGSSLKQGDFLSLYNDTYYIYGNNSVTIPVLSSHDITVTKVSAQYDNFSSDPAILTNLASNAYSYTPDGRESFTLNHTLVTDITSSSLNCAPITFKATVSNGVSDPKDVTIIQYPPIYISSKSSNQWVFINNNSNHASSGWDSQTRYKLIYDDGGEHLVSATYSPSFTYTRSYSQNGLTIAFSENPNYSGGVFGFYYYWMSSNRTITVTAPTGGSITGITIGYASGYDSHTVTYSPVGTNTSNTNWNGTASSVTISMDGTNNNANAVTSISVEYAYISNAVEKLGALRHYNYNVSNNSNYNIYTINVSDISGNSYGWYISDPRSPESKTYSTLKGGSSSGDPLSGYHPVDAAFSNAIAPKFKIASSSGASNYSNNDDSRMTYEQATRRCASYQENGYPAGRWRIPTDAEIRFVIELSNNGKIPQLFNGTYWAASGKKLNSNGEETTTSNGASVRCVYDAWFWGDEPMSQYMTTWSGWQTN